MAYLALYRKYRPQTFNEVIGQDALVTTLKNQIIGDKVGHAYLFCGVRGTGKTSTAKIFARAINCLNPINGSPCNKCSVCEEMLKSGNMDILEIDAASNNKVDEIRELRDKIQYPPAFGKRKVYIIDEVHMLTDSAFNALLKTLEEPPAHAVFILATTEEHKVPQTIMSRCMRFDFSLVSDEKLVALMQSILGELNIGAEKEALVKIATVGAGSVRDCLSILDKCVAFAPDMLTYKGVLDILGGTDVGMLNNIVSSILNCDIAGVFECVKEVTGNGKSPLVLNKDVLKMFRDMLVIKTSNNANSILKLPQREYESLVVLCEDIAIERLLRCMEILSSVEAELRYSINQRLVLESAFVKCATPTNDYDYNSLLTRVKSLEQALDSGELKKKL